MVAPIKVFIVDRRWAIASVLLGTLVGFISFVICVYGHIVIFGYNIAFMISPIIAGFVETYVAKKKYGHTTGAISAIILFFILVYYAFIFPEEPLTLNFLTIGGIILTIQAAFPILVNYLILVVFLGFLIYILGYIGNLITKLIHRLRGKPISEDRLEKKSIGDLTDFRERGLLILTTPNIQGKKISRYLGLVEGKALIGASAKEEPLSGVKKIVNRKTLPYEEFENAKNKALKSMVEKAKELGANGVIEVQINYTNVGGIKGNDIMVTVMGTAVFYEE